MLKDSVIYQLYVMSQMSMPLHLLHRSVEFVSRRTCQRFIHLGTAQFIRVGYQKKVVHYLIL